MRRVLIIVVVAAVAAGTAFYAFPDWTGGSAEQSYRQAKVERGEIVATVTATGSITPITTVIVSSQLSGQVVEILADYNSNVVDDQVVARLNSDQIRAKLDAARADLEQVRSMRLVQEAQIERVKADTDKARAAQADMEAQVVRAEALYADADRNAQRQADLRAKGIAAEAASDTARANRDAQRAGLDSLRAQVNSAKAQLVGLAADLRVAQANLAAVTAQVAQREATVRQIEVDLRNTDIRSPVSGVVVQRNIELGQTVAASLQAPTLFLIADDLHKMEIQANIDETDVGRIKPGQRVSFTVTAYPGRTFEGVVKLVRLGSQTVQNVVIYTAIISVENPLLELLPGMTASLRVETDRHNNVLRVPNAALRWRPPNLTTEPQPGTQVASADPGDVAMPAAGGGRAGGPNAGGPNARGGNIAELFDALKSEAKLSPEQVKAIDAVLADMRAGARGAGEQQAGGPRANARGPRQDPQERVTAILNPEQRAKFEEIRQRFIEGRGDRPASQAGRVFVVGSDGKPKGVTIRIGSTDGGNTEVISGLEAGADVITGGGPRTEASPSVLRRFGF